MAEVTIVEIVAVLGLASIFRTRLVSTLFAWSLPAVAIGIVVGRLVNRRIEAARFGRFLHVGLVFVALVLLLRTAERSGVGLLRHVLPGATVGQRG